MTALVQQSTTQLPLFFFMTLSSDHISAGTGLTCTVTISKNGGAFATPAGAVTEIANGWYQVAANATDTGTLGPILLHATAATADPCDMVVAQVVSFNPQNANLGLSNVSANVAQWNGSTVAVPATAGVPDVNAKNINNVATTSVATINANIGTTQPINFTGTGASALVKGDMVDVAGAAVSATTAQIGANVVNFNNSVAGSLPTNFSSLAINASGAVSIQGNIKKNTAQSGFMFVMTDNATHTPKTALTVTATRSLDGAAFASCANAVTEVANGTYVINLAATDTNANHVMLRFTAAGADDRNIEIVTQP